MSTMDAKVITLKRREIFFQNLLVLGFDAASMTKEHRTAFDEKMFCLPNQKAFEVVTHFLFSKLNEVSAKKYIIPWPLLERNSHRQFQKTCLAYLSAIAQETDIKFPILSLYLLSSSGDALYELCFAFSTYVVVETNKSFDTPMLRRAKADQKSHEKAIEVLQISTINSTEKFTEVTEVSKRHLENYFKCAKNLVAYIEKLKSANVSTQCLLDNSVKKAISLYEKENSFAENTTMESIFEVLWKTIEKLEKYWEPLEIFFSREEEMWNIISSELADESIKPVLKGAEYNIPIPDILKDSYIAQHDTKLLEETESLCIERFLKVFSIALEFYISSIRKGNFPQTHLFNSSNETLELENCLKKMKTLSTLLEKDNMQDKKHIEELMENMHFEESSEDVMVIHKELPPSPSTCTSASNIHMPTPDRQRFFYTSLADLITDENILNPEDTLLRTENHSEQICYDSTLQCDSSGSPSVSPESDYPNVCLNNAQNLHPRNSSFLNDSMFSPLQEHNENLLYTQIKERSRDPVILPDLEIPSENVIQNSVQKKSFASGSEIPPSWLLEESLNSQTLGEELSFLD